MTQFIDSFDARETKRLVGFGSVAMIDYLQRSGIFIPKGKKGIRGRGNKRSYVFRDLLVLKAIKRLLDSGASVKNLKKALVEFQKIKWSADHVTLEDPTGVVRYMIASSSGIYLAKDADYFINLSADGQMAFSFVIDLENLRSELRAALKLPPLQQELAFSVQKPA
jgi:hypothetical protein